MRTPKALENLLHEGVIQDVIRPLMSGKEAQVYLVVAEDRYCAAKIYKDAQHRSFKNRADYTEGRKVRNSRDQRAMAKGSKYGKGRDEDAWKHTEVDMFYRLRAAGVRVPEPYMYIDGVLLMELVTRDGHPAPRLGDINFSAEEALSIYQRLIEETARMLSAGVVHGDLSEFNVLLADDGPVIIDFPQSVNASGNQNAKKLFLRDVGNLFSFLRSSVPSARKRPYGEEMWELFEKNELTPQTQLTGRVSKKSGPVDTSEVMSLIGEANRDEAARRRASGQSAEGVEGEAPKPMRRREVIIEKPQPRGRPADRRSARPADGRRGAGGPGSSPGARGRPGDSRGRSGEPGRGRPGEGRPGGPRGRPGESNRGRYGASSSHGRSSGKPGRSGGPHPEERRKKNNGPKRGDGVVASTYVSPEARKKKASVMVLSPRNAEQPSDVKNKDEAAESSGAKRRRRRRPRRRKEA